MNTSRLPININDLLAGRIVEHDRIEYKADWNPDPIMRSVCAFANDFHNLGGGYIIIGVEESDGRPVLPPKGIAEEQLDTIQKKLLEYGKLIQPAYFPVLSIEYIGTRVIAVLWCPGGVHRPYRAPKAVTSKEKEYSYYIRRYSNSVVARDAEQQELFALAADVPFDDRLNHHAELHDLKLPLIQSFLHEVKSTLLETSASIPFVDLCRQMMIVEGGDEFLKPRNVGLMFFNDQPEKFFPLARIEVVEFPDGVGGDQLEEQVFSGPLDQQLREALAHLKNRVIRERVIKYPDRAEADRFFNYPYPALEEALVNAVYHRSYDIREPIEVRINPDSIEVLSFPGPDRSIALSALNGERIIARRYRNRRIGDFLKELDLTEGRGTGIPKIHRALRRNGSPLPVIESDEERTYFLIRIPIHPQFNTEDEVQVEVQVEVQDHVPLSSTEKKILQLTLQRPMKQSEIVAALGYTRLTGNVRTALAHLRKLELLAYTIPEKPRSGAQRYILTRKGKDYVQ